MPSKKTPTWVWVVLGIVGFFVLAGVLLIGGAVYMFRQHVHSERASKQDVQEAFDRARARLAGQQPLVEILRTDDGDSRVIVHRPPDTAERHTDLRAIRVLAFDPSQDRLVNADVPIWLARTVMSNRGVGRRQVVIGGDTVDIDPGDLTFEDLERRGPGLITDFTDGRGSQVLVWAE